MQIRHRLSEVFRPDLYSMLILLFAILVGWSIWSLVALGIQGRTLIDHLEKINTLQDTTSFNLLKQQIMETYFFLSNGDPAYLEGIDQAYGDLQASITFLRANVDVFSPEELALLDELQARLEAHNTELEAFRSAAQAQDAAQLSQLQSQAQTENELLASDLSGLIFLAHNAKEQALVDLESRSRSTLLGIAICLVLLPILGILSFNSAGQITHPILLLTHAITSTGSYDFHSELLGETLDRNDDLGRLARELEELAALLKERKEAAEMEVRELSEQLNESRRRKLRPSQPVIGGADEELV